MIIYTHYSDSHSTMFEEYFLKSLRNIYTKEDLPLKVISHPQTTKDGEFMSNGWLETMDIKLDVILQSIDENYGKSFIFSDSDVQFFQPFVGDIVEKLKYYDIACQEDRGTLCAGFFGCNANSNTKNLFQIIKKTFKSMVNDQVCLNHHKNLVKYTLLDKNKFFTIGNSFDNSDGTNVWDNNTNIIPPKNILIHHANYVIGRDNKLKLLKMIKDNYGN
jgi:hypothetical protein